MDLARREPIPGTGAGAGNGLVAALSKWRPHKTPRITASIGLYLFGLFVAFVARPPVTITDDMHADYMKKLNEADSNADLRLAAEERLMQAEMDVRDAKVWFWRFKPEAADRVRALQKVERERLREAEEFRRERDNKLRDAKGALGLWSALGIDETKALFRKSYDRGKVFATRQTFYDAFFSLLSGRTEENVVEFVLRWVFIALSNFTVGMMSAIISFMMALPALISTFATSTWSAMAFYTVAVIGAVSVVLSYLLFLYGAAAGGVYATAAVAPALLRLEQQRREQERARLMNARHRQRYQQRDASQFRDHID